MQVLSITDFSLSCASFEMTKKAFSDKLLEGIKALDAIAIQVR